MKYLEDFVGNTPLVALKRLPGDIDATVYAKLEGNNPAGSVKDRPALYMIRRAAERGEISPGDTLIEATSGNTGIALAMAAAMQGYRMILIMPDHMTAERRAAMKAFGAQIIPVSRESGMEGARDLAEEMQANGEGKVLDQFGNPDNWLSHYEGTGPEIWRDTEGKITHFVSSMGTTGTIMGVSRYFKELNPEIQIVGVQPEDGACIPGIRRWPVEYLPRIYEPARVDRIVDVSQELSEKTMRLLATEEGIFAGVSSGGAMAVALQVAREEPGATVVSIVCDRGGPLHLFRSFSGITGPDVNVLAFDIETIPDIEGGRKLYGLEGLDDQDVARVMFNKRREKPGSEILPAHLQKVIAISVVRRSAEGEQPAAISVRSLGTERSQEKEILAEFFALVDNQIPVLVSWDSTGFDLAVINHRGLIHSVPAGRYWDKEPDDPESVQNNGTRQNYARHMDLVDILAGNRKGTSAPLHEIAVLMGFPGKTDMSGSMVWDQYLAGQVIDIRNYCETDALNTYLVYLRWQQVKGLLSDEELNREFDRVKSALEDGPRHLQSFLASWE